MRAHGQLGIHGKMGVCQGKPDQAAVVAAAKEDAAKMAAEMATAAAAEARPLRVAAFDRKLLNLWRSPKLMRS